MTATKAQQQEQAESIVRLRKFLKPGATVHCVLRHVAKSGMSRRIDFYTVHKGDNVYLTGWIANALGMRRHKDGGLVVGGCGMDMGFAVVYDLSRTLFPKGFIPAKSKPKQYGRNGTPHDQVDTDGGYALRHHWL